MNPFAVGVMFISASSNLGIVCNKLFYPVSHPSSAAPLGIRAEVEEEK